MAGSAYRFLWLVLRSECSFGAFGTEGYFLVSYIVDRGSDLPPPPGGGGPLTGPGIV